MRVLHSRHAYYIVDEYNGAGYCAPCRIVRSTTMITNAGMYDIYYRIYVGNAVVDQQYWEYTRGTPCRIVRV